MWRSAITVFIALFLAELGDKTQLAVMGFATEDTSPWVVFLAATSALAASTALALLVGRSLTRVVPVDWLRAGAGVLFVAVGLVVLIDAVPKALSN